MTEHEQWLFAEGLIETRIMTLDEIKKLYPTLHPIHPCPPDPT